MKIEILPINKIKPYENNAKLHPKEQIDQIKKSIKEFGNNDPIAIDENNVIIEGHGRFLALKELGYDEVEIIRLSHMTDEQKKAYILAHNKLTMNSGFDIDVLELELDDIVSIDMSDFGFEFDDDYKTTEQKLKENDYSGSLVDDFIIMPQSIFDTRQGVWQNRKKEWLELGITSEIGREENMIFSKSLNTGNLRGTSIFDPVLCEVGYTWFTPFENAQIIDPFSGGSVRGIVAERLGYRYTGIDLRKEQIDANYNNAREIGSDISKINWICDDSLNVDQYIEDDSADLIFACPPYFDLEVYSDNDKDISNMSYEEFAKIYSSILQKFSKKLKQNRFAIVTISDVRDKKGFYRDLTGLTKQAFSESGVNFYNDIILVNALGSGALIARKQMNTGRKVVRSHQNVLVFYKGDPKNIKQEFGPLAVLDNLEED
nr:MAG TPA: Putative modification methylase [Caudoviricetes sp.]